MQWYRGLSRANFAGGHYDVRRCEMVRMSQQITSVLIVQVNEQRCMVLHFVLFRKQDLQFTIAVQLNIHYCILHKYVIWSD
jgi:hypothetical protein